MTLGGESFLPVPSGTGVRSNPDQKTPTAQGHMSRKV